MGAHRTCVEPDEIKKNTHPKNTAASFRAQEKNTFLTAFKPLRTGDACGPMEKIRESAYTTLAECAVLCQGYVEKER